MLYSSRYNDAPAPLQVEVYDVDWDQLEPPPLDPDHTLTHLATITLRDPDGAVLDLANVQSGAFSPLGHLYLAAWFQDDDDRRGIYGFDMTTGRQIAFLPLDVPYNPPLGLEVEGIAVWDYDAVRAADPSANDGVGGQLHVVIIRNTLADDPVGMKHFRIPVDERAFL